MTGGCKTCGKQCPEPKRTGAPRRYCSEDCLIEGKRRRDREWKERKKASRPPPVGPVSWQQQAEAKRRASGERYGINPVTSEPDYTDDETEFFRAVDRYKREAKRPFPTLRELLEIIRELGWRKDRAEVAATESPA